MYEETFLSQLYSLFIRYFLIDHQCINPCQNWQQKVNRKLCKIEQNNLLRAILENKTSSTGLTTFKHCDNILVMKYRTSYPVKNIKPTWVFPSCFHWIQWKKILVITIKGFEPATFSVREQDVTTAPARHMWETGPLNWLQFMLHWFIRFSEFAEFTEFLFHFGKTPMSKQK